MKKKRKKENYRAVIQSIEMHIMVHSQLLLGLTAAAYMWETWKVVFIK